MTYIECKCKYEAAVIILSDKHLVLYFCPNCSTYILYNRENGVIKFLGLTGLIESNKGEQ